MYRPRQQGVEGDLLDAAVTRIQTSELADILASVIQGSAIGPTSSVVTASDLQPMHIGNSLIKFADDTHIIVPAVNSDTSTSKQRHVQDCAETNNLKLNCLKSKEIVLIHRSWCTKQDGSFSLSMPRH